MERLWTKSFIQMAVVMLFLFTALYLLLPYGIGFGSAQPALQATNLRLADPDRRGAATASFMTAFDLGIGLGSIALGWVLQYTGYQALFMVSSVSVVVSLLIFTVFVRRLLLKDHVRQHASQ